MTTVAHLSKKKESLAPNKDSRKLSRKRKFRIASYLLGAILVITCLLIGLKSILVKADSSFFYPQSCLGGWTNPHNAEGKPQVVDGNKEILNKDNSAILPENTASDIYCGKFEGEIPNGNFAKKIILTFSWDIAGVDNTLSEPLIENSSSTESSYSTSSISSLIPNSPPDLLSPTSSPDSSSASDTSTTSDETHPQVVPVITAPETSVTEPSVETAPPEENAPESFLQNSRTSIFAKVFKESVSNLLASKAYAEESIPQEKTGNEFLEVFYTIDGKNWNSLGTVDPEHLRYSVFEIPLATDTKWSDMSDLQINIKSLSSIDGTPSVYLDGMSLQVTYGEASDAKFVSESGLYIPAAHSDLANFDFQIRTNGDIEEMVVSGAAPLGNIVVFNASTSEALMTTYVDGPKYILQPEYFGPGDYILIATRDPNTCTSISLESCRGSSDYVGEGNFTVDKKEQDVITDTVIKNDSDNSDNSTSTASTTISDPSVPDGIIASSSISTSTPLDEVPPVEMEASTSTASSSTNLEQQNEN